MSGSVCNHLRMSLWESFVEALGRQHCGACRVTRSCGCRISTIHINHGRSSLQFRTPISITWLMVCSQTAYRPISLRCQHPRREVRAASSLQFCSLVTVVVQRFELRIRFLVCKRNVTLSITLPHVHGTLNVLGPRVRSPVLCLVWTLLILNINGKMRLLHSRGAAYVGLRRSMFACMLNLVFVCRPSSLPRPHSGSVFCHPAVHCPAAAIHAQMLSILKARMFIFLLSVTTEP